MTPNNSTSRIASEVCFARNPARQLDALSQRRFLMKGISIALVAFCLIAGGCAKPPENTSNIEAPKPASKPDSSSSPDTQSLAAAFRNLASVKTYKAKMVSDRKQEGVFETSVSAVLPDRFYLVNSNLEVKVIGDVMFRKFPNGQWQKLQQPADVTNLIDPAKLEQYVSSATEVKFIGSEDLNGPSQIYEASFDRSPASRIPHGQSQPYVARVWIGQADGLPRKFEGAELVSQVKTEILYYDYNASITINPPMN